MAIRMRRRRHFEHHSAIRLSVEIADLADLCIPFSFLLETSISFKREKGLYTSARSAGCSKFADLSRPPRWQWRGNMTRDTVPDSRRTLIPPEVRAKIEGIEADARAKG
jgi:hypothetical protein